MPVIRSGQLAGHGPRASIVTVALVALATVTAAACSDSTGTSGGSGSTTFPRTVASTASVGDTILFNVSVPGGAAVDNPGASVTGCEAPNLVKSRVAAISNKSVIVVDTRNPTNGLTDAYYATIAQAFDTLVWPVDTRHFGVPSDIDNNGRVIAFFTRAVNGLTPANSGSYVGGFFYSRDIFPTSATALLQGCAGSNASEMFYLLAPDPTGSINGNVRDTSFIRRVSVGTMAHEFQHLISAERRLFTVGTQNYDEEVWLNEGMSHIAEELNFYQSARLSPSGQPGQSPRARLTAAAIRAVGGTSGLGITALNGFGFQNLGRFSYYLASTETYSPYSENDSLETRGATWSFLRYAFDRAGSTDSALTYPLVNSPDTGLVNLRAVLAAHGGSSASLPLETWFRDYMVANYADDSMPVPALQYTHRSWIFRDALTRFQLTNNTFFNGGVYPLTTRALANGAAQTVALTGGGTSYFIFSAPAGSNSTVSVTGGGGGALPTSVRLALVQTTGANAGTVTTADGTGTGPGSLSLANTTSAPIQAAVVVFNAATPATATATVTVTGTSIAAPSTSRSPSVLASGGPTVRALADARDPIMDDAGVMRRLRQSSRATLAPQAMAVRAAYLAARRSGDFSAWSRQQYVPGTVKGAVVPVGAGTRALR